jgi:poly(3-hydroxybutyrate) depolymerase
VDSAKTTEQPLERLLGLLDIPVGHPGRQILSGRTPLWSSQVDQRCSWSLYVPSSYSEEDRAHRVIVGIHGTGRDVDATRENLIALAESTSSVVVAPLFPCGLVRPNDVHNYNLPSFAGMRFDLILLGMLDEITERFNVDTKRFVLCGFSGGGQFAHHFAYLRSHRLRALSVGAPGGCTLIDDGLPWPRGTGDCESIFGMAADVEPLHSIPVYLFVGGLDANESETRPGSTGGNRIERLTTLAANWRAYGVDTPVTVVPGVGHDSGTVSRVAVEFIASALGVDGFGIGLQ